MNRWLALVFSVALLGADPTPAPSPSPTPAPSLYNALVTCPSSPSYVWTNGNQTPTRYSGSPLPLGTRVTLIGTGRDPAIYSAGTSYYETTDSVAEVGQNYKPHFYLPQMCVNIIGKQK